MALSAVKARARNQLVKHAPRVDDAINRRRWRARNRDRVVDLGPLSDPKLDGFLRQLRTQGIAMGAIEDLLGSREPYDKAATVAHAVLADYRTHMEDAAAGEHKPFLFR